MRARLVGTKGILEGEKYPLSAKGEYFVGRSEEAEIPLLDARVSREHCRFKFENGFFVAEDMESRNGTWVNGRRVKRAILFHGDRVVVGSQEFLFEVEEDPTERGDRVNVEPSDDMDLYATEIKEHVIADMASSMIDLGEGEEDSPDIRDLERGLTAVCRIIDVVHAEGNLDRLFRHIMDHVMHVSEADRGYLFGGRRPGGVIMPQVSRYRDGTAPESHNYFSRSLVTECFEKGYSILLSDPKDVGDGASDSIIRQNIQSVMCVPMQCESGTVGVIYVDKLEGARKFTKRDLRLLSAIGNQAGIAVHRAQLAKQVERLFHDCIRTLVNLVEAKDEYTYGHSERVTEVALYLAQQAGLDSNVMSDLRLAGLLHDVGKVAVPTEILRNPTTLSDSEYLAVQQHTTYGAKVVGSIENAEVIAAAVRSHHEHWDGSGYPDGLAGEDIPLLARILCVADSYDAMAADRPYRERMPMDTVLAEMEHCAGTHFDPTFAWAFITAYRSGDEFKQKLAQIYAKAATLRAQRHKVT